MLGSVFSLVFAGVRGLLMVDGYEGVILFLEANRRDAGITTGVMGVMGCDLRPNR